MLKSISAIVSPTLTVWNSSCRDYVAKAQPHPINGEERKKQLELREKLINGHEKGFLKFNALGNIQLLILKEEIKMIQATL